MQPIRESLSDQVNWLRVHVLWTRWWSSKSFNYQTLSYYLWTQWEYGVLYELRSAKEVAHSWHVAKGKHQTGWNANLLQWRTVDSLTNISTATATIFAAIFSSITLNLIWIAINSMHIWIIHIFLAFFLFFSFVCYWSANITAKCNLWITQLLTSK